MDDRFLEKFRKKPRPEFYHQLYDRLNRQEAARRTMPRSLPSKMLVQAFLAFSLVAVITLTMVMPDVLARSLSSSIHYLPGSIVLRETGSLNSTVARSITTPHSKVVDVEDLQVAQRLAGFRFHIPTWVPENMILEHSVQMAGVQESKEIDRTAIRGKEIFIQPYAVGLTYRDTHSSRRIQLWIVRSEYWSEPLPPNEVGKGSYESVKVNSLTGGLVQGQWNFRSGTWNYYRGGFLLWVADGYRYYLVTTGAPLNESDLLKMASSIKY